MEEPGGGEPDPTGEDARDDASDRADPAANGDAGISADAAGIPDDEVTDALPEDLDVGRLVGPHTFPNNNRRRVPGVLYLLIAAACLGLWLAKPSSPLVNAGFAWAGLGLALFGLYNLVAGSTLRVDEREALVAATREVGFAVGHASAQMGWRGLLSRPTWRILLYSAENPPAKRGLVLIDGINGEPIEHWVEDNPETWS
ncbi:MAG: hypothetical protein JJLCMIEE_00062 [Acidimicrobiales bacterium]|nr:hypothetical protein [Acidimicrobiales bacterium]